MKNAIKKINQGRGIGSATGEREEVGILNKVVTKVFPEGVTFYQRAERDEVSNHAAIGKRVFLTEKKPVQRPCTRSRHFQGAIWSQCCENKMNKRKISRGEQRGDRGISVEALVGHNKDFGFESQWQGSQWRDVN